MSDLNRFKTKLIQLFIILITLSTVAYSYSANNDIQITNLTVEYTITPLGIDVENPRFSWQMQSSENVRGAYQTAYQIEVKNPCGKIVWNSEKINKSSALSILITSV